MISLVLLALGAASAAIGGELAVRGTVGLARWGRVSPGIIGATIVAFATSSPELAVAVSSALAGRPQISLGDALGSNVVNVALILGLTVALAAMSAPRSSIRRDFPVALAVPGLTAVLLLDGRLSRLDGLLMMALFMGWLVATIREARRQRRLAREDEERPRARRAIALTVVGLAFLAGAGPLVVGGARGIALALGISEFVIGVTLVAVGTSLPELATAVVSKLRGHDEIGLGAVLGSNIFNGLWIIAVAAVIHPIDVDRQTVMISLAFGAFAVACVLPTRAGLIRRWRAMLLLAIYAAFVVMMIR